MNGGRLAASILAFGLLVVACGAPGATPPRLTPSADAGGSPPVDSGPPIAVLGTENFYADLLAQIGGERVSATSLLNDPNADPHAFESSPADAAVVADAKVVIVNGLGYDAFMDKLLGSSQRTDRAVIDVQQLLALPDDVNVHVWYDPSTMAKVAPAATQALSRLDPANATWFANREQAYLDALKPIDAKVADLKARYAGTPIAFTEDVAGYLTGRIGLVVKTPVGFMKAIEEGTDPAPVDVADERDLITGRQVRLLLFNSQVTSPATDQVRDLARQQGIPVVGVAETMPSTFATYQDWQRAQLAEIEQALAAAG